MCCSSSSSNSSSSICGPNKIWNHKNLSYWMLFEKKTIIRKCVSQMLTTMFLNWIISKEYLCWLFFGLLQRNTFSRWKKTICLLFAQAMFPFTFKSRTIAILAFALEFLGYHHRHRARRRRVIFSLWVII